jgi:threonine dehydratase
MLRRNVESTRLLVPTYGDEALEIIDMYRDIVDDQLSVDPLTDEFPYIEDLIDDTSKISLASAHDNKAGTFKWRGAIVKAVQLQRMGVESIRVPSAGNHLRGSVLAAKALDLCMHGVVPTTAPRAKTQGAQDLWPGGRFFLHKKGSTFDESLAWTLKHKAMGELIHPYDDPWVIAGQGTIVDDILEQVNDVGHIIVPVGGGGLVAGILTRLRELERADITVHGVEAPDNNSLSRSLQKGRQTAIEAVNLRYGGSAVKKVGIQTLAVCMRADNLRLWNVTEQEVDSVVENYEWGRRDLLRSNTPNLEPTSLVAITSLRQIIKEYPDERVVVVGTGQNDSLTKVHGQMYVTNVWH